MASRNTYTLPVTPGTPNFRLPAPPAQTTADWDAVRSPLLSPNEEAEPVLVPEPTPTSWAEKHVPLAFRSFVARNTGLLLIMSSQAWYSCMAVFVKTLNSLDPPVPPLQLIFIRMLITYVCCTSYMLIMGVNDPWIGPKGVRFLLIFRGFCGFFGLFGFYYALQFLSLSDATVITFLTPSVTAVSGAVFLREKLRMAELYSALVSLMGVILIARPAFIFGAQHGKVEEGATAAQRFTAVCVALFGVLGGTGAYTSIRAIGKRAHAMHSLTSFSSQCVIASSLLSLFLPSAPRWTTPTSPMHLLLFLLIGIMGFVAQALMTLGYQRETAGRGSMGIYAQIVFAAFWDRVVFHAEVKLLSVIGTVLILGSALYVALTKPNTPAPGVVAAKSAPDAAEEGLLAGAAAIDSEEVSAVNVPLSRAARTHDEALG